MVVGVAKITLLIVVSSVIIFVSWPSLRNRQSHGFYRFFAFGSILLLFLLNVEHWLTDPFSARQIVSWVLLAGSLVLVVHGFHLLRVIGRPKGQIEDTTTLVMQGAYRYVRHPLYSSLLLLGWGVFLKDISLIGGILALTATVSLIATARVEEAENLQKFGEVYTAYMRVTKMFVPFLF